MQLVVELDEAAVPVVGDLRFGRQRRVGNRLHLSLP